MAKKMMPLKNPLLYGPGPFIRKPFGVAAMNPLHSLVKVAIQGTVLGLIGAFGYKFAINDPYMKTMDKYYKENP